MSITIHIAQRNQFFVCAATREARQCNEAAVALLQQELIGTIPDPYEHVKTPVTVHIAQRGRAWVCYAVGRRGHAGRVIGETRGRNKAAITLLQQQLVGGMVGSKPVLTIVISVSSHA